MYLCFGRKYKQVQYGTLNEFNSQPFTKSFEFIVIYLFIYFVFPFHLVQHHFP